MMECKVSFLVPVYNVARYIGQCAKSIFEQTLDDIEIIFVDDCTPDNSVAIVEKLLEQYPNRQSQVRWVHHDHNMGIGQARRSGVEASSGEYVLVVDSDDYVDVTIAEKLYNKAIATNADVVQYDFYKVESGLLKFVATANREKEVTSDLLRNAMVNRISPPDLWARLIRRQLFFSPEFRWAPKSLAEDVVMTSELMLLADNIVYLPEPLYYYRINPSSITNVQTEQAKVKRYQQYIVNSQVYLDAVEKNNKNGQYNEGIIKTKMAVRNQIISLTNQRKYRKMWHDTFPELNQMMIHGVTHCEGFEVPASFRNRLWYYSIMLGLYPSCSRLLLSRKLRPAEVWRFAIRIKLH